MARASYALNLILVAGIVWLGGARWSEERVKEAERQLEAGLIPGGGIRVMAQDSWPHGSLIVDFGTPMLGAGTAATELPNGAIRLVPPVRARSRWKNATQLEIRPERDLRRASIYHVLFDPKIGSEDGRRLPAGFSAYFETARMKVLRAVFDEDDAETNLDILLSFDLPVDPIDLATRLEARTETGTALSFVVEPQKAPREHVYRIRCEDQSTLRAAKTVDLVLDGALKPSHGGLDLGLRVTRTLDLREDLAVTNLEYRGSRVTLEFNRTCLLPEPSMLSVDPPVPFRLERSNGTLALAGDFKPGSLVRVTLAAGFPGKGRGRLREAVARSLVIPDLSPAVRINQDGEVLSSFARPEIRLEAINVSDALLEVRTVYPNNAVRFTEEREELETEVFGAARSTSVAFHGRRNVPVEVIFDLRDLLGAEPLGIHELVLRAKDDAAPLARRILQITDLGVTVRASKNAAAVHVASLAYAKDIPQASVRIVSRTNQELARGETGLDGIALLRWSSDTPDDVPFLADIRAGDDRTFVDTESFQVSLAAEEFSGRPFLEDGLEACVTPDRGAVRPGEVLRATVIIRDGAGRAPAGHACLSTWFTPDAKPRRREAFALGSSGLQALSCPTDTGVPTGTWRLDITDAKTSKLLGSAPVRVEAFVPERLEATASLDDPLRLGGAASLAISARWLDGSVAAGLPVRVAARFDHRDLHPDGYENFSFARIDEGPPPGAAPVFTTTLDDQGRALTRIGAPARKNLPQSLLATIQVEVEDPSGRPARTTVTAGVSRPDFLLGVGAAEGGAEVVLLDPQGLPSSEPRRCTIEVEKRRRIDERERLLNGHFRLASVEEGEGVLSRDVLIENGRARVAWDPIPLDRSEQLLVRARIGEVIAEQRVGELRATTGWIRVAAPEDATKPGGTARLKIDSPITGRAFVTLEDSAVRAAFMADIPKGMSDLEVKIPEGLDAPTLYAVITVTTAQARKGAEGPYWIAGGAPIAIDRSERRCAVTVSTPPMLLPGSELVVGIDAAGAHQVTVAVVDEGILRLTQHRPPDPHRFFTARRRLETLGADTGMRLASVPVFDPDVLVGGDGDDEDDASSRMRGTVSPGIETLALFETVMLDDQGRGTAKFKLPPYEGRVRVDVIAAGSRVAGGASASVVVQAPLGLRAAAPRFLAPGDRSEVVLTFANATGQRGTLAIELAGEGGITAGGGPGAGSKDLELEDGGTRSLSIGIGATQEASLEAGLRVKATLGDARREIRIAIPVRPLANHVVEREGFVVDDSSADVAIPGRFAARGTMARIVLDPAPIVLLLPALEALVGYPHGCVEQTTSKLRGLIACRSLLPMLYPEGAGPVVDDAIATGVDRLFSMQTPGGGLGFWPGVREEYPFGSLGALDTLLLAKEAGGVVPEGPLKNLVKRVANDAASAEDVGFRAAAAAVLARAGSPIGILVQSMDREVTAPEDRANLARALALIGETAAARKLIDDAAPPFGTPLKGLAEGLGHRDTAGFLRSPIRAAATELMARLDATPASPRIAELQVRLFEAVRAPGRLTTQELGHALLALARAEAARATESKPTRVKASLGGREIPLQRGRSETFAVLPDARVHVESEGRVFGLIEVAGWAVPERGRDDLAIGITRTLVDLLSGKTATEFQRGRVYEVRLSGRALDRKENLLVTDVVAGGFEIEPCDLWTRELAKVDDDDEADEIRTPVVDHCDLRDDRVLFFVRSVQGRFALSYRVRAVFPGDFAPGFTTAEGLYQPGLLSVAGPVAAETILR